MLLVEAALFAAAVARPSVWTGLAFVVGLLVGWVADRRGG